MASAPIDISKGLTVLAARAMWRAGRKWAEGATELTPEQAAEIGEKKLQLLAADPNFTLAAAGTKAVTFVNAATDGAPIDAHTVVFARRAMWRGGRQWAAGATALSPDQVKELGDKLDAIRADTANFTVTQNGKAEAAGKKAAPAAPTEPAAS